jgi:hypothetical protein
MREKREKCITMAGNYGYRSKIPVSQMRDQLNHPTAGIKSLVNGSKNVTNKIGTYLHAMLYIYRFTQGQGKIISG